MEEQISHFKILEEIGSGGMGVVYRARDQRLHRRVALKVLPAGALAEPMVRERLMREAQTASSLNHPHIVTVFEIHSAGDRDFIAMEFVDGRSLDRLVGADGLTLEKALRYGIQIADGLSCAHEHGVIHRDLKPQNVMITPLDDVKILDFGLAKRVVPPGYEPDADNSTLSPGLITLTAPGVKVGTPAYMSPEQIESRPIDARSDVFSFGCLLYEMLTGVSPFHRRNAILIFKAVLSDEPQPLRTLKPKLPADLERILDRAMRKAPGERPQNMREVLVELEKLQLSLFGTGLYSNRSGIIPRPELPRRRTWFRPAFLVAGALAFVLGLVVVLRGSTSPPQVSNHHLISTLHALHRQASFSPDGERIAFVSDDADGVSRLWTSVVTGADSRSLDQVDLVAERPRWFADGSKLLVGETGGGIWSVSISQPRSLARLVESGASARLSPDGSRLVLEREGRIWVGDSDGTNFVPLASPPPAFFARWVRQSPSFSPDGRSIAFFRPEAGPFGTLWVSPVGDGEPRRLMQKPFRGEDPLWTPNGKWLIFSADLSGESSLWCVSASGGKPIPLIREGGRHTDPELSADGRQLVFTKSGNSHHLKRLGAVTGEQRELFGSHREIMSPTASPDGSRIAFSSPLGSSIHIFTVELDGGSLHQVTQVPDSRNLFPQWSADGKTLYYYQGTDRTFRKIPAGGGPSFAVLTDWSLSERYATAVDPLERRVAYTPLESGAPGRLRVREFEDGEEQELATVLLMPQWSPDGGLILGSDGEDRLYLCPVSKADCRFLTHGVHPRWAPDAESISFVREGRQVGKKRVSTIWRLELDTMVEEEIAEVSAFEPLLFGYDLLPGGDVVWQHARTLSETLWIAAVE